MFRVLPLVPADGPMTQADWKAVADRVGPDVAHTTKAGYGHFTGYADLLWRAGDPAAAKAYQARGVQLIAEWNAAHKPTLSPHNVQSVDLQLKQQEDRLKAMDAGQPYAAVPPPAAAAG